MSFYNGIIVQKYLKAVYISTKNNIYYWKDFVFLYRLQRMVDT